MRAYRLDPDGVERKGKALLAEMSKNLAAGISVRRPVRRLKKPDHPSGPTPAQEMHAEFLRREAAGWFKK